MNRLADAIIMVINVIRDKIENLINSLREIVKNMYNRIIKTYTWSEENETDDQKEWADKHADVRNKKNKQNKQRKKEGNKNMQEDKDIDWDKHTKNDRSESNYVINDRAEVLEPTEFEFDTEKQILVATIYVDRLELQTTETHTVSADDYIEVVTTDGKNGIISEIKIKNGGDEQTVAITANHVVGLINPNGKKVGRDTNIATGAKWIKVNHFVCCSVRVRHTVTYIQKGDIINILTKTAKDPIMSITKVSSVLKAQYRGGLKTVGITISLSTTDAEKMMSGCVCMTERLAVFVIVMGITLEGNKGTHFLAVPLDPKIPRYDVKMVNSERSETLIK